MPVFAVTPTTNPFDPEVFDWSFHVMDIIPTLNKVLIDEDFSKIEAGQAVAITINIQDIMTTPGVRFDFDPASTPQIQIYNPDGSILQAYTNMNFIAVTGYYNYQLQTLISSPTGVYTARFKAVNGTMTMQSDLYTIFELTGQ